MHGLLLLLYPEWCLTPKVYAHTGDLKLVFVLNLTSSVLNEYFENPLAASASHLHAHCSISEGMGSGQTISVTRMKVMDHQLS